MKFYKKKKLEKFRFSQIQILHKDTFELDSYPNLF